MEIKSQMGNIKVWAGRLGLGKGELDGVTWVLIKIKVPVWTFIISSKSVQIACADSIRESTGRRHCRCRQPCVSQSHSAITPLTSTGLLVTTASRSNKQTLRRAAQPMRTGASPLCFANKSGRAAQWRELITDALFCLSCVLSSVTPEMQMDRWFWWSSPMSFLGKVYIASAKLENTTWLICSKLHPYRSINYPKDSPWIWGKQRDPSVYNLLSALVWSI